MARTDMRVLRRVPNRLQEAMGACDRARDVILHIAAWYGHHDRVLPTSETDDPSAQPASVDADDPLIELSSTEMAALLDTLSDLPDCPMETIRRMRGLSAMRQGVPRSHRKAQ